MHKRSHWGWGYEDRFGDLSARRAVADHAGALLGFDGLSARSPVPLEAVELPPPRLAGPASLATICDSSAEARITHTYGRGYRDLVRGFAGDFDRAPDIVARPKTEDDIAAVLDWCTGANVAVIPYGGGTSVVGGVEGVVGDRFEGVLSLDLRGLDRVLEVDPVSRSARIQAGALGPVLEAQLAEHGLTLRHYPQSYEFSTLGGWIATRAGGHYATQRTRIDDFVESIRMIAPAGVCESRRLPGSGAGPSPDALLLGSEGALGVITEAWVRVTQRPRFRSKAAVHFKVFERAVDATRAISQSGLQPANCRLLDMREARLNAVAQDGSSVLLLGFESADHVVNHSLERALAIAIDAGGALHGEAIHTETTTQTEQAGRWREAFFEAPYLQNTMVSLGVIADTFETACTWDAFADLHAAIVASTRAAMKRIAGKGHISCRFTHVYPDGPAPYYTFLAPARVGAELEHWAEIKQAATEAILAHGGTITHHHAVGRTHRGGYDRQRPDLFGAVLRAAKACFDPAGILNPGVLVG